MGKKPIYAQITVEQAAERLGLSPRTVVNYLHNRELEGVKVGKKWFVNSLSVEALAQKYGFSKLNQNHHQHDVIKSGHSPKLNLETNSQNKFSRKSIDQFR